MYFAFSAYDSAGNFLNYIYREGFFTRDTIYTIPAGFFNVSGASYYIGWVHVEPVFGPMPAPGATSNAQGSIKGYLYAVGEYDRVDFFVGTPYKKSTGVEAPNPTKEDIHNAILKRLSLR